MVSLDYFAHTWKLAERVKVAMGVRRNFSRGGATSTFCLSFSGCWRCHENGRSQNALLFLHHKENLPWKQALFRIYFEIFFKWNCRLYEFATKVYFGSSVITFAKLAYKCRYHCELSKTTFTALSFVCGGWTEHTSEIFYPNCFLHFGYQKCFFFS